MNLEHELQRKIILKLIHNPSMSFNELWGKEGESNAFAYHLNKLEEQGLVEKKDNSYRLTSEGKKLSAFIEGDSGDKAKFPTLNHFLIIRNGDKFLLQKRLKEPFYGYWGFISGKINFGWNVLECAKRDFKEETGLDAENLVLRGLEQTKTIENSNILYHHLQFIVEISKVSGKLIEKTHKAENEWMTLEEYKSRNSFPLDAIGDMFDSDKFFLIEVERTMKDGKFVGSKVVSKKCL